MAIHAWEKNIAEQRAGNSSEEVAILSWVVGSLTEKEAPEKTDGTQSSIPQNYQTLRYIEFLESSGRNLGTPCQGDRPSVPQRICQPHLHRAAGKFLLLTSIQLHGEKRFKSQLLWEVFQLAGIQKSKVIAYQPSRAST